MKPKIAFFDFASCEGCQLQVVNLEMEIPTLLELVDIVAFREAMTEAADDYAIAFVEGSITRESDIPRLKKIRERAAILVSLGACAATAGVNALKNRMGMNAVGAIVYGDKAGLFETFPARPVHAVVPVDYTIPGCPIHKDEFLRVVQALLLGKKPEIPDYPVCVECKLKDNLCVYELGQKCLGPITRAGCGAWCPSNVDACEGCRGFISEPNKNAQTDIMKKYGLTPEMIMREYRLFNAYTEDSNE